jgi:hypothetical protein
MLRGGAQLVANVATVAMSNRMPVILFFIVMCFLYNKRKPGIVLGDFFSTTWKSMRAIPFLALVLG